MIEFKTQLHGAFAVLLKELIIQVENRTIVLPNHIKQISKPKIRNRFRRTNSVAIFTLKIVTKV